MCSVLNNLMYNLKQISKYLSRIVVISAVVIAKKTYIIFKMLKLILIKCLIHISNSQRTYYNLPEELLRTAEYIAEIFLQLGQKSVFLTGPSVIVKLLTWDYTQVEECIIQRKQSNTIVLRMKSGFSVKGTMENSGRL